MVKFYLLLLIFYPITLLAQTVKVGGSVRDAQGEPLPFANVLILPDSLMTACGSEGKFSISLQAGEKTITISYTGFQILTTKFILRTDTSLVLTLATKVDQLKEVIIDANRYTQEELVRSTRSGTTTLTAKDITGIPVLMGEADVIKTLQLLPGTIRGVEGSSDLFVRGGAADQNLVLLDNAPIYNTSHLFGFLSVFNPDILDKVEAINGGFPAAYGGRLSSILDVKTLSEIPERTHVSADIGLIASRLFVEQPLIKNKASFWVAARRTYIDHVVRAIGEELPYFFYDLNGKIIFKPTAVDHVEVSHYSGEDILDLFRDRNNDGRGFLSTYASGNSSQSLKWTREHMRRWVSDLSLTRTAYQHNITNIFEENSLVAFSDIEDYSAHLSFAKDSIWKNAAVKTGASITRHSISPKIINSTGSIAELLESSSTSGKIAHEIALFAQYEASITDRWKINAGIRGSMAVVKNRNYFFPEPRLAARYEISNNQALKLSYSRMAQYMHRISNSALSMPTDIWYPVTDSIRPQNAHQVSAAWQRVFSKQKIFFSVETYYKSMRSLIGYEEGTNLFFNTDFESTSYPG